MKAATQQPEQELIQKLNEQSIEQLQDIVKVTFNVYTPQTEIVFDHALTVLEQKMNNDEFVLWCAKNF